MRPARSTAETGPTRRGPDGAAADGAPEAPDLAAALDALAAGGLLAFPTETVWGLAADATRADALARLRAWKQRDAGQPLSVLVTGLPAVEALGYRVGPAARRLAERFWPGPLTLVLAPGPGAGAGFAPGIAREDGAVGFRCSPHPVADALARGAEARGIGPLTATSLNRHGEPPAEHRSEARRLCGGPGAPVPVRSGADAGGGAPSTVIDCTGPAPRGLRAGAIAENLWAPVAGAERGPASAQRGGAGPDGEEPSVR